MRRLFISPERIANEEVSLQAREVRYLVRVLRLESGDHVLVFTGEGQEFVTQLIDNGLGGFSLVIKEALEPERESPLRLILAQGLLKGEKMKFVIQKITELGVTSVIPLITARAIPLVEEDRETLRLQRWETIAREAAKQSGRAVVPRVQPFTHFEELLGQREGGGLILWEDEPRPLRQALSGLGSPEILTVAVGPEGGFSEQEVAAAQESGFVSAGLGSRILRAETAAVTIVGILQHTFGDLG